MAEEYSIGYIDHIFFIHSSFDGRRGSFHSLAIVDIAARNIGVQVFQRFSASVSLGENNITKTMDFLSEIFFF